MCSSVREMVVRGIPVRRASSLTPIRRKALRTARAASSGLLGMFGIRRVYHLAVHVSMPTAVVWVFGGQAFSLSDAESSVSTTRKRALSRFRIVLETVDAGMPVALERRRTPNALRFRRTSAMVLAGFCENANMLVLYHLAVHLSRAARGALAGDGQSYFGGGFASVGLRCLGRLVDGFGRWFSLGPVGLSGSTWRSNPRLLLDSGGFGRLGMVRLLLWHCGACNTGCQAN